MGWRKKSTEFFIVVGVAIVIGCGVTLLYYFLGAAATIASALAPLLIFPVLANFPLAISRLKVLWRRQRWRHMLWSLMFLSGLVFRARDTVSIYANPLDFWAIFRVSLMAFVTLALLGRLTVRGTNWLKMLFRGTVGLLTAYCLTAILSTAWSAYPVWTLYRSLEYFVDVCLAAATITTIRDEEDLLAVFDWAWVLIFILIASVWVGMVLFPERTIISGVGVLGMQIQGAIPAVAANGVGELGALLAIMSFARLLFPTPHKWAYLFLFTVSAATMVFSQSRSAITGFLLALPLVLFISRRIGVVVLLTLLLPAFLFLTSLGDLFFRFFMRGQSQELFTMLSGRVYWWKSSLPMLRERPFWGYGAYAGARFIVLAALDVTLSSTIHNTWLEVMLGIGLLGLVPLLATFIWIWVLLMGGRRPKPAGNPSLLRLHVECIGILAILSVRSLFTTTLIWHPPLMFLLVLVYAERLREGSITLPHQHRGLQQNPAAGHRLFPRNLR